MWARRKAEVESERLATEQQNSKSKPEDLRKTLQRSAQEKQKQRDATNTRDNNKNNEEEDALVYNGVLKGRLGVKRERNDSVDHHHEPNSSNDDNNTEDDIELDGVLARKKPRGRGGIGSRMDFTGPYLPRDPGQDIVNQEEADEELTLRAADGVPNEIESLKKRSGGSRLLASALIGIERGPVRPGGQLHENRNGGGDAAQQVQDGDKKKKKGAKDKKKKREHKSSKRRHSSSSDDSGSSSEEERRRRRKEKKEKKEKKKQRRSNS